MSKKENTIRLKELAITGIMIERAMNSLGIYPKAWTRPAKFMGVIPYNKTTKRTKKEEGWNEACMALTKKWIALEKWYETLQKTLDKKYLTLMDKLLMEEIVRFSMNQDKVEMYVGCNDLFFWGCSDAEDFTLEDMDDISKALKESPNNGALLWVARKRKMRPQPPCYEYFNEKDKKLFDACGPERAPKDY